MVSDHPLVPVALAFIAATLWGLWWVPIRLLEGMGLSGAWSTVLLNLGAACVAGLCLLLFRKPSGLSRRACAGAVLIGLAVTTYSVSLSMTDVVRAILLFYLAPAWSKLIETVFMGQPWRMSATIALTMSLVGAVLVLGGAVSVTSVGPGDGLAVLSGMAWAAGAALTFSAPRTNPVALTCVTAVSAICISLGFIALGFGEGGPSSGETLRAVALALALGAFYVLPILALTLWSAQKLSPAVLSFLMTAEILSGVGSSALFLDEPFMALQMLGALLVIFAAMIEVISSLKPRRI